MSDKERELFESELRKQYTTAGPALTRRVDMAGSERMGEYFAHHIEFAWKMWSARAALDAPVSSAGHGHVVPRADGVKARCGGPALCQVCQRERAALEVQQPGAQELIAAALAVVHRWHSPLWRQEVATNELIAELHRCAAKAQGGSHDSR